MRRTFIVAGLGFGDEGKGSWVDHLVRRHGVKYVVRFNGGAQAGHNVVAPDGREHIFAQFGAGMFTPGTHTCLSRFMLIEPEALLREAGELEDKRVKNPLGRMIVSASAPIITPFNRLLNRIQEIARGASRHGSCGFGIGITQRDVETLGEKALYVRDIQDGRAFDKLKFLQEMRVEEARGFATSENSDLLLRLEAVDLRYYSELFAHFCARVKVVEDAELSAIIREHDTVFEGAQGVLLDQWYGFFPHCTRSNCTFKNAQELLCEAQFAGTAEKIGLLRGYGTRHGAGPFACEDSELRLPPCHNQLNKWQGGFRLGWFDAVAARYALKVVAGVDTLAITNLDRLCNLAMVKVGTSYRHADQRFFTEREIRVPPADYGWLSVRTNALTRVVPEYRELPGFRVCSAGGGMERYIEILAEEIDHPIHALSLSPAHQKVYR